MVKLKRPLTEVSGPSAGRSTGTGATTSVAPGSWTDGSPAVDSRCGCTVPDFASLPRFQNTAVLLPPHPTDPQQETHDTRPHVPGVQLVAGVPHAGNGLRQMGSAGERRSPAAG